MEEIRDIYKDYVIVVKDIRQIASRIEMDILVAPSFESLYKWLWRNGVVTTQIETLKIRHVPKKEDEDVIHYFIEFLYKYHYTYTESARIYLNISCKGRHGLTELRIIDRIRERIDKLPQLRKELTLFLQENLSLTITPNETF